MLSAICMSALEICLFRASAHFLIRFLLLLSCVRFFKNIFWLLAPFQTYHLEIFFPSSRLPFCFVDGFLHVQKLFSFM